MLGGTENVIALSVQSQLSKQVIENDETLVLRFATPNLAATWLWRLHLAKQRMEVLMPRQLVADAGALNGSGEERGSSRDQASRSPSAPDLQAMHSNPEAALREQETKVGGVVAILA